MQDFQRCCISYNNPNRRDPTAFSAHSEQNIYTPRKKLFSGLNRGLGRLARQHIFVSHIDVRRTKERYTEHGYKGSRVCFFSFFSLEDTRIFIRGCLHSVQSCRARSNANEKQKQKHSEQMLGFNL
ncbi:unnamed protein product [Ixodes persulcatus]